MIRNCYGNNIVKLTWMFEWMDFRYRKMLLDLDFVNNYIRNVAVSKFFQFGVANKANNLFLLGNDETLPKHCVKSIQLRSFSWSVFSQIWTEYGE